ncbi:MAG: hypothetical protein NTW07_00085, partial [candidate division Zixibacteria bacterium]|nr:hypothetical protein [candidate division Zixibacteria bacterium]
AVKEGNMKRLLVQVLSVLTIAGSGTATYSQQISANVDSTSAGAAKVYIECASCEPDFINTFDKTLDFIKIQITFVNFVRDRAEADIHVLITTQYTSTGGREFTIEFIGQKSYGAMVDTLKCYSQAADTQDAIRSGLVRMLKMGLVRYVARTPLADDISVTYSKPALSTAGIDKWNYWVLSIDANSNFNGQKTTKITMITERRLLRAFLAAEEQTLDCASASTIIGRSV